MRTLRPASILCLAALWACTGNPGEARIELYEPATAESRWQQTVGAQRFDVEEGAAEGRLRIAATDFCWSSTLFLELALDTGEVLDSQRSGQPRASAGGGLPALNPPTACASGLASQRLTLSNGELIDLCLPEEDGSIPVANVASRDQRFRLPFDGSRRTLVTGDQLLRSALHPDTLESYSLLSGEKVWSWTAPDEYTYLQFADPERVYLLAETGETFALSLADGSVVWQQDLACDSLSLASGALVCHQTLRESGCEHE